MPQGWQLGWWRGCCGLPVGAAPACLLASGCDGLPPHLFSRLEPLHVGQPHRRLPPFVPLQSSDREQGQGTRYSTQEAAVQLPALAEQQEWEEQAAGQSSSGQAGGVLEEAEAGLLGLDLHDNPSFLADSFDAEAAAAAHTLADEQQRQQEGAAASAPEPAVVQEAAGGGSPEVTAEACGRSLESSGGGMWQAPKPVGLILLHPGAPRVCCCVLYCCVAVG